MKFRLQIGIASAFAVVLFIVGWMVWPPLFMFILPVKTGVYYIAGDFTMVFRTRLMFGLTLAMVPFALLMIWRFGSVKKIQKKILTVLLITICMIVSVGLRREVVKSKLDMIFESSQPSYLSAGPSFPMEDLQFELYTFIGMVTGSALSLLIRDKNNAMSANARDK